MGALGGTVLVFEIFVLLLGGNWQLGYAHDRILASIFVGLVPAAVGIVSPLWYWLGRPVWYRLEHPGSRFIHRLRDAQFLPGLAGAILGISLVFPVSATSRFWVQVLAPFGLAVALASPLWYWILRPIVGRRVGAWLPGDSHERSLAAIGSRLLPTIGVLFVLGIAITAAIALPVVAIGGPVTSGDLTMSITDARTTTEVTELNGETFEATYGWRFLLIRLAVENEGDTRRPLPGRSVGDVAVIAPECSANNFGEPANNCNQVYVDGDFSADGEEYTNYDARQETVGGTIGPRERITGWLVFRLENPPTADDGFQAMVIVDDIGRWAVEYRS